MNNTDIKTVERIINSENAKKKLDELNTKLETARRKKMESCGQGNAKGLEVCQGMHGCSSVIGVPFLRMCANVLVIGVGCDDVFRADGCLLCTLGVN